jgi:hypothetical protein
MFGVTYLTVALSEMTVMCFAVMSVDRAGVGMTWQDLKWVFGWALRVCHRPRDMQIRPLLMLLRLMRLQVV